MPQAPMQSNQILGDGALLNALKKGGNPATPAKGKGDGFQNLLSGLVKARLGDTTSANLTALVTPAPVKLVDITVAPVSLQLAPELQAVLKKLNITALKNVPQEIAVLFNQASSPDAALSAGTQAFLDALAALPEGEAIDAKLFTLIDDPKLAQFLAGLNAMVLEARNESVSIDAEGMVTVLFNDAISNGKSATTALPAGISALLDAAKREMAYFEENALTIADMDGDAFQALKKLAFADIAPYLTMPRTVHAGGNSVMKIAQGPSFLHDGTIDATMMANIPGLMAALPPQMTNALIAGNGGLPAMDPAMLAAAKTPVPGAQGLAGIMAALMGAANADATQGMAMQGATPGGNAVNAVMAALTGAANASKGVAIAGQQTSSTTTEASTSESRGFATLLTGLENDFSGGDFNIMDGGDAGLPLRADTQTPPPNTVATMMAARAAGQPHPATHLVSVTLQRAAENAAAGTERQFTIQMEPANLGRVRVTLEFGENNAVKAKILAERPETVALLQKDAAFLERALQGTGLDAKSDSLSFTLAGDGAFSGGHDGFGGGQQGGENTGQNEDGTEFATIENVMQVFVDPDTGLTHVNVVI